jgi:hypothetical protein
VQLKAERQKFQQQIEEYRKTYVAPDSKIPEYFKKKKAHQKERRKEKHELIKANRAKLVEIFGDAIFKRGWPVSRKEIKDALGLKEEEHDKEAFLGEFLKMVGKEPESNRPNGIKLSSGVGESRMLRVGKPIVRE